MAATNKAAEAVRLAGGFGAVAANQNSEALLRRSVMACLLWEDVAYASGEKVVDEICKLIPLVAPETVAQIAVEARYQQKLRHVPLLIVREMAKHTEHRKLVRQTLARVVNRADELAEFLSLYWREGKRPIAASVKKGLADAFKKFNEYQLAKYNRDNKIKLRDVLFMVHAKPKDDDQAAVWRRLINGELATPDTWEVGLSAAKTPEAKKDVWQRLLVENKLGSLALLRNLRNMQQVGVSNNLISEAILSAPSSMLLPINFFTAQKEAPVFTRELEVLMLECIQQYPKLPGRTVFVVDVSGSMCCALSAKSSVRRLDVAAAMTVLAAELCENVAIYATSGDDGLCRHNTVQVKPYRGFALADLITSAQLGGGGIFTRQCLEFIATQETDQPDRIIVFSDSQDCDHYQKRTPNPFGKRNYIIDVSCNKHGINYKGLWDAEISGWSEHFLRFIAALESNNNAQ